LRKLVAALAFLAVTALPATVQAQPHWHRGEEAQVTVYVERTQVGPVNWSYVKRAGAEWARSSRIEVLFVKRCPSSYYCVKVYQQRSSRNLAGWATMHYDPKTNTAWYGSLHLNTRYLTSDAARRKTTCHELGHVLGLDHRRAGRTCMRDGFGTMYGHPDAADFANLRRIYANASRL
jgi:predicted Zn-dependent protease